MAARQSGAWLYSVRRRVLISRVIGLDFSTNSESLLHSLFGLILNPICDTPCQNSSCIEMLTRAMAAWLCLIGSRIPRSRPGPPNLSRQTSMASIQTYVSTYLQANAGECTRARYVGYYGTISRHRARCHRPIGLSSPQFWAQGP